MNFVEITVINTDRNMTHRAVWPARDLLPEDALSGVQRFINRALEPERRVLPYHWLGAEAEAS